MKTFRDTWQLFRHYLTISLRNPTTIIVGLLQPITWLLLFAPLLQQLPVGAGSAGGNTMTTFAPGMLVLLVPLGALFAGIGLIAEQRAGVIERLYVTPVNRLALVLGRALRDITVLLIQSVLLVAAAWLMGLQANLAGVALGILLLMLVGLMLISCSYALALNLRDENAVASITNVLILPLMLLSGVFLPLTLAPGWIRAIASVNPLSYAIDALRALFLGQFADFTIWFGYGIITALAALALVWAARSFRHAVS